MENEDDRAMKMDKSMKGTKKWNEGGGRCG